MHPNFRGVQIINLQAIAKVCMTDIPTVDLILREMIAQLRYQIKKGVNVRLFFKIGRLKCQNGVLNWSPYREEIA